MQRSSPLVAVLLMWSGLALAVEGGEPSATEMSEPTAAPRILLSPLGDNASIGETTLDAWTGALASELARSGAYRVMTPRDVRTLVETEELAQLLGCLEARCVANLSRTLGADFIVSGQVGLVGETRVMTLAFLEAESGAALSRVTRSLPSDDVMLALERAADELLARARGEVLAELAVVSEPAGAAVFVDGRAFGTTPLPATALRPGDHLVVVQKEAHHLAEETVTLIPARLLQARFTLAPVEERMKLAEVAQVAEEAARAGARQADEALRDRLAESERSTRTEMERTRQTAAAALERSERLALEAESRRLEEAKRREQEEASLRRRRLGGFSLLVAHPFLNTASAEARSALTNDRPPLVVGLSAKLPLFWKLYASARLQALPPFPETLDAPAGTTPDSFNALPLSFVEATAGVGAHFPLPGPFFIEADAGLGPRVTIYVRDVRASSGATYREAPVALNGVFAARAALGVGFGVFEACIAGRASIPLVDEPPLPSQNAGASVGGFQTFGQLGVEFGLSF